MDIKPIPKEELLNCIYSLNITSNELFRESNFDINSNQLYFELFNRRIDKKISEFNQI